MRRNEDGMVTAFAVVFSVALLLFAGLVLDGGTALATKRHITDQAQSAARQGAQAIDTDAYRSFGAVSLDADEAQSAAASYLANVEQQGTVAVVGSEVRVTVKKEQPMQVLGIGGLRSVTVTGVGVARAERG